MRIGRLVRIRMMIIVWLLMSCLEFLYGQTLSTGLSNINASGSSFMFDLKALRNIEVDSFDVQIQTFTNLPVPMEVWTTNDGGSFVGRSLDPSAWHLVASFETLLPLGLGFWTQIPLNKSVFIQNGTQRGFCIVRTDLGSCEGFSSSATGLPFAANSDLVLEAGIRGFASYFGPSSGAAAASLNVHYTVIGPVNTDLRTSRIIAPVVDPLQCALLSNSNSLTVELVNLGSTSLSVGELIPLSFQVDDLAIVNEFLAVPVVVPTGGAVAYTFSTPINLSPLGTHVVKIFHNYPQDQYAGNDMLTAEFHSGGLSRVSSFPWIENFEQLSSANLLIPPVGWVQESMDATGRNSDWFFINSDDQHWSAGVSDHTSGQGFWSTLHDHASHFQTVSLRSPCIDLGALSHPRLEFWLHSFNLSNSMGNLLSVDILDITTGTTTVDFVGPISGFAAPMWVPFDVDLSAYSGALIQIIFRGTTDHGSVGGGDNHDLHIDDVMIKNVLPTPGQEAQQGFAIFRIGAARNVNLEFVDSYLGGPFFSTVSANDDMILEFEGEPMMPILFLGGPLNPAVATFPVIGKLDLGNVIDPMTGIPTGLQVLADGNLTSGLDSFFNTGPLGTNQIGIHIGNLPPGILANFQCVMRTSGANGSYIALSNVIQVTVQ